MEVPVDEPYWQLVGRKVEVRANDVTYRGILVEMGPDEIHLESEAGWITLPMSQVTAVEPAD